LPVGFEILWPEGTLLLPNGDSRSTSFVGKPAIEIPCKASAGHKILLYVHPESLMPVGCIAIANGTEYETSYNAVIEKSYTPKDLIFVAPKGSKPFSGPPNISKLIKIGTKLPDFMGKDINGRPLSYREVMKQSKGLVLNFWFSSCVGCVQEMPVLARLTPLLQSQKIAFVGVNPIDANRDAKQTSVTNGLKYATLTGAGAKKLAEKIGAVAYPVTLIVNAQGVVVDAMIGFDEARLMESLKNIGYRARVS
jgi:peroxiredoxin